MSGSTPPGWEDWAPGVTARVIQGPESRAYRVTLSAPADAAPSGGWPVVWVLDAAQHGLTIMETARRLARRPDATRTAPMLVAGIQPADGPTERAHRYRDFTAGPPRAPEAPPEEPTGGASVFANLLLGPAWDLVRDTGLASEGPPALWGHSLSGWFALWAVAERPHRFGAVAAISPSLWWDEACLSRLPQAGAPVFLAIGERETDDKGGDRRMIDRARSLHDRLSAAETPTTFMLGADEDHASIVSTSAAAALRFLSRHA